MLVKLETKQTQNKEDNEHEKQPKTHKYIIILGHVHLIISLFLSQSTDLLDLLYLLV